MARITWNGGDDTVVDWHRRLARPRHGNAAYAFATLNGQDGAPCALTR